MSRELVIERTAFGARAALLCGGRLVEVRFAEDEPTGVRDRVFLGRVRRFDAAQNAAFVDCGLNQEAWLTARHARPLVEGARSQPLSRQLYEGRAVLVQGLREAGDGKGPRVTADISLPGMYLVLRPRRREVELSARLARVAEGRAQRARASSLFPDGGLLLRRAALLASDAELLAEAARLREVWREIEARASTARAPACLHDLGEPVARLLVALLGPDVERIIGGDRASFARARDFLAQYRPALADCLEHVPDAFAATGAEEELAQALSPVVPLDGGGSLVIEPTAALTAIDVNGGGRAALEIDLAAVAEIARQIRLRRIGGTIVIDFVDLATRRERDRVDAALRETLREVLEPVRVWPMNDLGLVQLSRRRAGPSLAEELGRACPTCGGTGMLPALRSRSEALVREMERVAGRARVHLAPDLHDYLQGEGARVRGRLGSLAAFAIDASLPPGGYRIDPETNS